MLRPVLLKLGVVDRMEPLAAQSREDSDHKPGLRRKRFHPGFSPDFAKQWLRNPLKPNSHEPFFSFIQPLA